ncbi:MAG: hypothetical protein JO108_01280 [Acidobacteriaceae bacterium]|nr:hypothetical protein [Acidobacteriaceae bacterium]
MSTHKDKMALRWSTLLRRNLLPALVDSLLVTSVPFLLCLLNQNWIYTKYSNLDEWMYVGLGYHYLDPIFYATNYKIGRLPWVLLEAVVRGSFSPLVSSWILAFGVLALGNIAFYFALRIHFGRLPALFASLFLAGMTFMHANGGADYHNTLAGAFYCLSMLLAAKCAREGCLARDLVFFGASLALTVHTNPVFINLLPVLLAQCLISCRVSDRAFPPLVPSAFCLAFGALAVTVLLGFVNFAIGRQFLFFSEELELLRKFVADSSQQKQWWEPWSSFWFLKFPYMGLFLAGALLSSATLIIAVLRRSLSSNYAHATLYAAANLCAILIWTFWQSIGQTAFEPSYFAYPLGFPLAGAIAAALATGISREIRFVPLTLAALCFSAAIIAAVHKTDLVTSFVGAFSWPLGARVAVAFSIAFAALILLRWSLWFAPLAAVALCTANSLAVYEKLPYITTPCNIGRDAYFTILDASSALRNSMPRGARAFVFSEHGNTLTSGAACKGWEASLGWVQGAIAATGFEDVAPYWSEKTLDTVELDRWKQVVATKALIGFLTYEPARVAVLRGKLEAAGGTPGDVRAVMLHSGDTALPFYVMPLN